MSDLVKTLDIEVQALKQLLTKVDRMNKNVALAER
jgi:hypothetical protein